jgi:hypothetical protein
LKRSRTTDGELCRQFIVIVLAQGIVTKVFGMSQRRTATLVDCGLSHGDAQVTFSTIKVTIIVIVVTVKAWAMILLTCRD